MSGLPDLPEEFFLLLDDYCSGLIDDDGLRRLEAILRADPDARRAFILYFKQHSDLLFAIRGEQAAHAALVRVDGGEGRFLPRFGNHSLRLLRRIVRRARHLSRWSALAVAGLAVLGIIIVLRAWSPSTNVAWLINARDCRWAGADVMPGRDMRAGKVLRLERGLAEIEFDRGARVILRGPAGLELLSGNGARLLSGVLTARVPPRARGFTVLSPQGRVLDLGTEFGLSVDERNNTAVHVFEGQVVAAPGPDGTRGAAAVTLRRDQAAQIANHTVTIQPGGAGDRADRFVRAIVPPPTLVPRTLKLDFSRAVPGTLLDGAGKGTGLTHRLSGTGEALPERDENLRLDLPRGVLELTTTPSDLNGQFGLPTGEYLGIRLSDLGFTGREDFAITATVLAIPRLEVVGQFGLFAGSWSDRNIRGGVISPWQPSDSYDLFLVNNNGGRDTDINVIGLTSIGDDLRLTLQRIAGKYALVVENQTRQTSNTLAIAHPAFLDGEANLSVGIFGAKPRGEVGKPLTVKALSVTVWTLSSETDPTAPGAG